MQKSVKTTQKQVLVVTTVTLTNIAELTGKLRKISRKIRSSVRKLFYTNNQKITCARCGKNKKNNHKCNKKAIMLERMFLSRN